MIACAGRAWAALGPWPDGSPSTQSSILSVGDGASRRPSPSRRRRPRRRGRRSGARRSRLSDHRPGHRTGRLPGPEHAAHLEQLHLALPPFGVVDHRRTSPPAIDDRRKRSTRPVGWPPRRRAGRSRRIPLVGLGHEGRRPHLVAPEPAQDVLHQPSGRAGRGSDRPGCGHDGVRRAIREYPWVRATSSAMSASPIDPGRMSGRKVGTVTCSGASSPGPAGTASMPNGGQSRPAMSHRP